MEERFKDFPEWEGDRFSGQGIKKMKGYKCSLKIDELNNLREEFWVKRLKISGIWKHIRHACILDDSKICNFLARALKLLKNHELVPIDNCLKLVQDNKGQIYRVPNWCINDPFYEKALNLERNSSVKKIKIWIQDIYNNNDKLELDVNDDTTSLQLKQLFFESTNNSEDITTYKIRLIYKGCELKDNETIYEHSIPEGSVILLVKNKIDQEN